MGMLEIYNKTSNDITCANGTVPGGSTLDVSLDAYKWARDPLVVANLWMGTFIISAYGQNFGSGGNGLADIWLQRIADGKLDIS